MSIPHFTLGFIIGAIIMIHIILSHGFSSCNPLINNHPPFSISSFLLFSKDAFVSYVIPLFISFYSFWDPDIFGNADNPITANPLPTPTHTLPERHSNIYHSIPRAFPNKVLGVIVTAGTILMLLLVFYLMIIFMLDL